MYTSSPSSCSLSSLSAASTTHWLSPLVLPSLLPYPHGFFRLCSVISAAVLSSPCLFPQLFLPSCRVQSRPQQLAMDHNLWCSACVLEINIEQENMVVILLGQIEAQYPCAHKNVLYTACSPNFSEPQLPILFQCYGGLACMSVCQFIM